MVCKQLRHGPHRKLTCWTIYKYVLRVRFGRETHHIRFSFYPGDRVSSSILGLKRTIKYVFSFFFTTHSRNTLENIILLALYVINITRGCVCARARVYRSTFHSGHPYKTVKNIIYNKYIRTVFHIGFLSLSHTHTLHVHTNIIIYKDTRARTTVYGRYYIILLCAQ